MDRLFFAPTTRRWPTVVEFARDVRCTEFTAREWLRNDSIPAGWFSSVVRSARQRGFIDITHEFLASRAEARRERASANREQVAVERRHVNEAVRYGG